MNGDIQLKGNQVIILNSSRCCDPEEGFDNSHCPPEADGKASEVQESQKTCRMILDYVTYGEWVHGSLVLYPDRELQESCAYRILC